LYFKTDDALPRHKNNKIDFAVGLPVSAPCETERMQDRPIRCHLIFAKQLEYAPFRLGGSAVDTMRDHARHFTDRLPKGCDSRPSTVSLPAVMRSLPRRPPSPFRTQVRRGSRRRRSTSASGATPVV